MLEVFLRMVDEIKTLQQTGKLDESKQLLDELEPIRLTDIHVARAVVAGFLDLGLSGRAHVSLETYCRINSDDQEGLLDLVMLRVNTKFYKDNIPSDIIARLNLAAPSQFRRLAECWKRVGRHDSAVFCYQQAAELAPDDPYTYAGLAQTLIYLGRKKEARGTLQTLAGFVDNQAFWWSFIAEQSSKVGDKRLFAKAVARLTPLMPKEHGSNRMALTLGFENFGNRQAVQSMLDNWDLTGLTEGWVISNTLDIAERWNAATFQLAVAKHALGIELLDRRVAERCSQIVQSYERFGAIVHSCGRSPPRA